MDCRERGSHARGVYPTQYISRMGTARVKQEEKADTRIIVKEEKANARIIVKVSKKSGRKERGHYEGKSP